MAGRRRIFTSESVTEGHPDKVSDGISDAILDATLKQDPTSRVACETMVSTGLAVIAGEISTNADVDYADVVRDKIKRIGYTDADLGFSDSSCAVMVSLDRQSPDIAQGVSAGEGMYKEQGAGDQGMMFGYACNETRELMPMPIMLSHKLTRGLARSRRSGRLPFLRPDGKAQVSVVYEDNKPVRVDTVVVSTQHSPDISYRKLKAAVIEDVVERHVPAKLIDRRTRFLINPTGRFVLGGPQGDCGLTGRKIIVDTYGGMGRHGGGAFSGKDPSKVDRSAAYMARYVAKNIVAAKLANRCEVCSWPTQSDTRNRSLFWWTHSAPGVSMTRVLKRPCAKYSDLNLRKLSGFLIFCDRYMSRRLLTDTSAAAVRTPRPSPGRRPIWRMH